MESQRALKVERKCYHCGDRYGGRSIYYDEKEFCCEGCKTVYSILNKSELCDYYKLNAHPGVSQKVRYRKDKFSFLDLPEVEQKLIQFKVGEQVQVTFYLPQIHCSSCLWLLENISHIRPGIMTSNVNFTKKEVFIIYNPNLTTLREVVEALADIGYEPHISLNNLEESFHQTSDRAYALKIGIVGFCFANIMMFSVPEYVLGSSIIEAPLARTFKALILLFSLPVLFYGAAEFFRSAWKGLKHRYLNIDAPIALALIVTFGRSVYEVYQGGNGYFDSLSGIVFFMLIGRWLQDRTYQAVSFDRDFKSFFPIAMHVIHDGTIYPKTVDQLRPDDVIQVHNQEIIPVDAILSKGNAWIDYSFVSGESEPVSVEKGEMVYAGGKQIGAKIELVVVKEVSQSYLTNLWNQQVNKNKQVVNRTALDTISTYFTYIVFAIAAATASYWFLQNEIEIMWNVLTTILIVACPCALLLSNNFTNGNILRILSTNQFYLRSPQVIGDIAKISYVVFDKTGTLTQHQKSEVRYEGVVLTEEEKEQIAGVLSQSYHPSVRLIDDYLGVHTYREIQDFKLTEGQGVEAWIEESHYKIGSPQFTGVPRGAAKGSQVVVCKEGQVKGIFYITNAYRYGIFNLVQKLKNTFRLAVISGDNDSELENLKAHFGKEQLFFDQKPQDKLEFIRHLQQNEKGLVMMIGDGLNDAGALIQSDVGIAVADSNNTFTPASDGIIDSSRLAGLDKFIQFAKDGNRIILFSFMVSILYNIIGLYFAVQGLLSPMIAAILMPSSSISIVLITYGMSEWMARYRGLNYKENNK